MILRQKKAAACFFFFWEGGWAGLNTRTIQIIDLDQCLTVRNSCFWLLRTTICLGRTATRYTHCINEWASIHVLYRLHFTSIRTMMKRYWSDCGRFAATAATAIGPRSMSLQWRAWAETNHSGPANSDQLENAAEWAVLLLYALFFALCALFFHLHSASYCFLTEQPTSIFKPAVRRTPKWLFYVETNAESRHHNSRQGCAVSRNVPLGLFHIQLGPPLISDSA